jgi:hypothetical protein
LAVLDSEYCSQWLRSDSLRLSGAATVVYKSVCSFRIVYKDVTHLEMGM